MEKYSFAFGIIYIRLRDGSGWLVAAASAGRVAMMADVADERMVAVAGRYREGINHLSHLLFLLFSSDSVSTCGVR